MSTLQKMMYLALILAISKYILALPTHQKAEPTFCRGLECPEYDVVMKTADFEERCYSVYKWASTDMSGNMTSEENIKFYKLGATMVQWSSAQMPFTS